MAKAYFSVTTHFILTNSRGNQEREEKNRVIKLTEVPSFFSAENPMARHRVMAFPFELKLVPGFSVTRASQEIEK